MLVRGVVPFLDALRIENDGPTSRVTLALPPQDLEVLLGRIETWLRAVSR
jgi:hypothetical protein